MTEEKLRRLIKTVHGPLLVTDKNGAVLAENAAWSSVRKMLGGEEQTVLNSLLHKIADSGEEQVEKTGGLELEAAPCGEWIVFQPCDRNLKALHEQFEDTVQSSSSYQEKLSNFGIKNCIASSESMIRVFTKAKQVAAYPTTILLLGETGVGKEVVSSFIHHNSDRAAKPFI